MGFNYKQTLRSTKSFLDAKSPVIMSSMAVAGVFTTAYLTYEASAAECELVANEGEFVNWKQRVRYTWRIYIPPVLAGTATVCSIVLAQKLNTKKQVALAGAYAMSERLFNEYKDEVRESLGDDRSNSILDRLAKKHVDETEEASDVIFEDGPEQLCYDDTTGRYFMSTAEDIRRAVNEANATILQDGFMSLNEFNSLLDLPYVSIGEKLGWDENRLVDVYFSSHLTKKNRACLSVMHRHEPQLSKYLR